MSSFAVPIHTRELNALLARRAKVLIEDAENHRSIFHKLDARSLDVYETLNSSWFDCLTQAAIAVLHLLAFFEWPSSLTMNSDVRNDIDRPVPPCGLTESVEALCLLVILVQSLCILRAFGFSWLKRSPWLLLRFVLLVVCFVDLCVSLRYSCKEFYRIRRFFRPYFLISNSQLMKKLVKSLERTLPKLLSTLFLLLLWLVAGTLAALCLFSGAQQGSTVGTKTNPSFPDFYTSMFNLLVLITTANHPDVLVKFYNRNRASVIFCFIFLGVGLYVFMNILTAIVYGEFRGYFKSSVQSRLNRRRVATRAAFEVLRLVDSTSDVVSSDSVIELLESIRISDWKKQALRESYISHFAESELTAYDFMHLFRALDLSSLPYQESHLRPVRHGAAQAFQLFIISSGFAKLSIAVSILNLVNLAIDLSDGFGASHPMSVDMRIINWCFVVYYLFEEFSFMWAIGVKTYFHKWSNMWSLLTVLLLLVAKLIEIGFVIAEKGGHPIHFLDLTLVDVVRLTNLLLLARTARVAHLFTWTKLVAGVLLDLPRNLTPVLGIFVSAYYIYALLGISLFRGAIRYPSNFTQTDHFPCGTYQQLEYWSINFDDFLASVTLLWSLMVVNNWFVFVIAYQEAVSVWVHVYMISWWLIVVVGILSLVTAFVIETFVHRRDQYTKALSARAQSTEVVVYQMCPVATNGGSRETSNVSLSACPEAPATMDVRASTLTQNGMQCGLIPFAQQRNSCQQAFPGDTISSFDELFSSNIREPTEEELLSQIDQHKGIQRITRMALG